MPFLLRPGMRVYPSSKRRVQQAYAPARPHAPPPPRTEPDPSVLLVHGMQGMGDNLHQRALIRRLLEHHTVYLETPWPSLYHDLVGPRLQLLPSATSLRTQQKNVGRERDKYATARPVRGVREMRVWYTGEEVRKYGSIYAAMMMNAGYRVDTTDFRLPIPEAWYAPVDALLAQWCPTKPVMVYRPLVERTEWKGCAGRNPDLESYVALLESVRDRFFVVSVADLAPGKEWIVSRDARADVELHQGELPVEALAALTSRAALMFCSAGFAPLLAQAVGTPVVCVFGGHESSMTIKDGARFAPTLGVDPIIPCDCFDHHHAHKKAINMPKAIQRVREFVAVTCGSR